MADEKNNWVVDTSTPDSQRLSANALQDLRETQLQDDPLYNLTGQIEPQGLTTPNPRYSEEGKRQRSRQGDAALFEWEKLQSAEDVKKGVIKDRPIFMGEDVYRQRNSYPKDMWGATNPQPYENEKGFKLLEDGAVPSFQNYLKAKSSDAVDEAPKYAEEQDPSLGQALRATEHPMVNDVKRLGTMDPKQRAYTGARLGAAVGLQTQGPEGGIIGAAIGAMAGRGAGLAQSGEHQKMERDQRLWNTLKTMGVASEQGAVKFDGEEVPMPPTATDRLKNLRINPLNGGKDRTMYELDKTNPLTSRTMKVARPLGMFFANGMLGYGNGTSEADKTASTAAMAMFANIFQEGAKSDEIVYHRARQMVKNMGLSEEAVRNYFSTIKTKIKFEEAEDIKQGLDIIFTGQRQTK